MPTWDPQQYLKFEDYRSRPCKELVARLAPPTATRVIDLGCGPGNSTEILMDRYPTAQVIAIDTSNDMLAKARTTYAAKNWHFESGSIDTWSPPPDWIGTTDIILANASFQYATHHEQRLPALMNWLRPGGQLAIQMPRSFDLPVLKLIADIAHDGPWKERFATFAQPYTFHATPLYHDFLAPCSREVDLVEVSYFHTMRSPDDIVEWSRGTGLRPWLEHAGKDADAYLAEYRKRIHATYPRQADGTVLMKFRRLMILATR